MTSSVPRSSRSPEPDLHRTLMLVSQLGFTMLVSILAGFGLGFYLDRSFGTFPLFLVVFLLAGIACGFWRVYRLVMRAMR